MGTARLRPQFVAYLQWRQPLGPATLSVAASEPGAGQERAPCRPLRPELIRLEALPDTRRASADGLSRGAGALWETTVGAAVLLHDPRRRDGTAYLGLLRCVNDVESLERFVGLALEQAARAGCRRLVGPTGLSPHLQSGVLLDHFHVMPPLHTPYNPPYVPEVMQGVLSPLQPSRLFHVSTAAEDSRVDPRSDAGVNMLRLAKDQWQQVLVPLLVRSFDDEGQFPPPDAEEATFLLEWVSVWPLAVWAAIRDGEPAGYVMLQPDLAAPVARARGGRNPLWRVWLAWRSRRPTTSGRLLFAGVSPEHRGRGVGSQLWRHALAEARRLRVAVLTIGPLPPSHAAVPFLEARGAQAVQSYMLYAWE